MSNLLPESNKKNIRKEYLLRIFLTFLILSSLTLILLSFFLLPSYFLSKNKSLIAEDKTEFLTNYVLEREKSGVVLVLMETNEKMEALHLESVKATSIISAILDKKNKNVDITGLTFRNSQEDKKFFIDGRSLNREALISFAESLKSTPGFFNVDLPISNLTRSENLDFGIRIDLEKLP